MGTTELQSNLHKLIDTIQDRSMLSKAYTFLYTLTKKTEPLDDFHSLPIEVKEAIEEGASQLDNGQGISYEAFRKEVKNK